MVRIEYSLDGKEARQMDKLSKKIGIKTRAGFSRYVVLKFMKESKNSSSEDKR